MASLYTVWVPLLLPLLNRERGRARERCDDLVLVRKTMCVAYSKHAPSPWPFAFVSHESSGPALDFLPSPMSRDFEICPPLARKVRNVQKPFQSPLKKQ